MADSAIDRGSAVGKLKKADEIARRLWRTAATASHAAPAEDSSERPIPTSIAVELVEASWVGSSWDLLTGLDVVETEPGQLFDEFFDPASGAARELPPSVEPGKDPWVLAFSIELADLDRELDPTDVIRLAKTLWRKKRHLSPKAVARDAFSTGWMLRAAHDSERS